jgi:hypothetical protein
MKNIVEEFIENYEDRDYEARYYSGNPLAEVMDERPLLENYKHAISTFSEYNQYISNRKDFID